MLALAAIVVASAQQAPAVAWQHTVIRHERFEDFEGGPGSYGVWLTNDGPLTLRVGKPGIGDKVDPNGGSMLAVDTGTQYFESKVLDAEGGFDEATISWNISCPRGVGVLIDIRVDEPSTSAWSPWLHVERMGAPDVPGIAAFVNRQYSMDFDASATRFDGGEVRPYCVRLFRPSKRAQYRIRARCDENAENPSSVRVRRVVVVATRRGDGAVEPGLALTVPAAVRRITIQRWSIDESETADHESLSLLMCSRSILKYRGESTFRLLEAFRGTRAWPVDVAPARVVQAAYELDIPGYVARFSAWSDVERLIASRQPLVIRVEGADRTDPDPDHDRWIVLCGFDEAGDVCVEDAFAPAVKTLRREALTRDWLARGGTALVFLPAEK